MLKTLYPIFGILLLFGCAKSAPDPEVPPKLHSDTTIIADPPLTLAVNRYVKYSILKNQHYSDSNLLSFITVSQMNFSAKFDSSAVYQSLNPVNQYDINKLYGFSEGYDHQYNSARIGWSWNNGALRLYAYAYNNGLRESKEISKVDIGAEISCSITLLKYNYQFEVNGVTALLPRAEASTSTNGYQLYPYFGGDEVAPHDIYISIKNL